MIYNAFEQGKEEGFSKCVIRNYDNCVLANACTNGIRLAALRNLHALLLYYPDGFVYGLDSTRFATGYEAATSITSRFVTNSFESIMAQRICN